MEPRYERALARLAEVETWFQSYVAAPNAEALRDIESFCVTLGIDDSYVAQNAARLKWLAGVYFSHRKHQNHGGEERVRRQAMSALNGLRQQIQYLGKAG